MLEEYFIERYRKTKWPFFRLTEVVSAFSDINVREELEILKNERKIRFRAGINGVLIEIGQKIISQAK